MTIKKLGITLALLSSIAMTFFSCKNDVDEAPYQQEIDLEIESSDLKTSWEKYIELDASKFLEMVSGDFITFAIEESESPAEYFQIQFSDSEFNNFVEPLNIEKVPTKFEFHPTDENLAKMKSGGLIVKGYGIKITKAVITTTASLLTDKKATPNAKRLFAYMNQVYGTKVITGQMENAWNDDFNQLQQVYDVTGKYPALMGFDFMNYTGLNYDPGDQLQQTSRAINFWNGKDYDGKKISDNHGIVTFCWHWFDPLHKDFSFKPDEISFRIPYDTEKNEWKTESDEYKALISDMDVIAVELSKLQDAGVPVIWRPLHEGAGNVGRWGGSGTAWFWWGAGNSTDEKSMTDEDICSECYIALWKLMYEYFTEEKNLHNLIWMWNGQHEKFYPGSKYVDMIGDDIYDLHQGVNIEANERVKTASGVDWFKKFHAVDKSKMVALSECGAIPKMEDLKKDNAMWSFFMVWNDSKNEPNDENFWNGQVINPDSHKKEVYGSDIAITLDELPDLTK